MLVSVLRKPAIVGLCVAFTAAVDAHPVLTFVEQTITEPAKGATGQKPGAEQFLLTVTLGRKYLIVESPGTRRILDFERRRQFKLDLANKTFEEGSLYSEMLSLTAADDPDIAIETAHSSGATAYRSNGKELLSISDKTRALAADYQADYWRYLRYTVGGDSKIYDELEKRTGIPELLRATQSGSGEKFITLRLTSVTTPSDAPYSLDGFTRAAPKRDPYVTLQKIGADEAGSLAARTEAAKRDRDAAVAQGKMLDAALAHFTSALSTGDADNDWLMQVRDQINKDPDAAALAASLRVANAEQAANAVKTLKALRAKSTSPYAYLLDVFAANHHASMRHTDQARQLFLSALAANPYLTGAWFDLGRLYYGAVEPEEAWACWDAARALNPAHPFAKNVETMERQMAADHPDLL